MTTTTVLGGLSPAEVSLVSGGDANGTVLRLSPEEGSVEHATLTFTQELDQLWQSDPPETNTTRFSFAIGLEVTVVEVTDEGDIVTNWVYDSVDLLDTSGYPAEVLPSVEDGLEQLEGLELTQTTDSQGRPLGMELSLPEGMDPTMETTMRQTADQFQSFDSPFPTEPVSEGASWEVEYPVEVEGIEVVTSYLYTLTGLDGTHYGLTTEFTQSIETGQEVEVPGMGPGILEEIEAEGSGTIEGDLSRVLPTESAMEMSTRQVFSIDEMEVINTSFVEMNLVSD